MDLQATLQAAKEEDGWQIVTRRTNRWRTPFGSVSWSYSTTPKLRSAKHRQFNGSLFLRLNPSDASNSGGDQMVSSTDVTLNPDLCGVRIASEALCIYEANVGFHYSPFPDLQLNRSLPDLSVGIDEGDVLRGKEQWGGLVERLGGVALDEGGSYEESEPGNESGESSPSSSLHRSTSTLSSVDSDLSTDSISFPSTPKAKNSDAIVHIKDSSPNSSTYSECSSPVRPLNASASSFIPSFIKPKIEPISFPPLPPFPSPTSSPSPPPTFVNFTFPTLDVPPLLPVKIKKDEQGFYSEVKSPSLPTQSQKPSIDLLPPFLQERRKAPASKTRAMVERLRSSNQSEDITEMTREDGRRTSHCSSPSLPFYNLRFPQEKSTAPETGGDHEAGVSSSSLEEDEEGWINLSGATSASPEAKAQRTRDLFLALTRRRSDSLPAIKISGSEEIDELVKETISTTLSSPSLSPAISSNDGWLEGPAVSGRKSQALIDAKPTVPRARTDSRPRSRAGRKRRSSNHSATVHPFPAIPHPFMPPPNLIARPLVGTFHPAASISFPIQHPPAPFFQSPYSQMMVPPPYAPYMLQMQIQAQAQAQMRGHRASSSMGGEWFSYPQGVQPFMSNPSAKRGSFW